MLRNPRVWLVAAGGWLVLAGLAHAAAHVWYFVLENDMVGMREFAVDAMKQAESLDPLRPSLWRQFRAFSTGFGLLFVFAGVVDLVLWWSAAPLPTLRTFALASTLFWTVAFGLFALVDPVIQALLITAVAVPMHGIAFLTSDLALRSQDATSGLGPPA